MTVGTLTINDDRTLYLIRIALGDKRREREDTMWRFLSLGRRSWDQYEAAQADIERLDRVIAQLTKPSE